MGELTLQHRCVACGNCFYQRPDDLAAKCNICGELNDGHCIQYAFVGERVIVRNTEDMSDDEVRADSSLPHGKLRVERFDRCIECEVWTKIDGKLRESSECPAVNAALAPTTKKRQ